MKLSIYQKIMFFTLLPIIIAIFLYTLITDKDAPAWANTIACISIGFILIFHFIEGVISLLEEYVKWRIVIVIVAILILVALCYLTIRAL